MIPLLRVDLRSDLTGDEYPSRILWSEDNPGRPPQQRGMKLMLDPVSLIVVVDDLDMIPSGHWIKARLSKPTTVQEATEVCKATGAEIVEYTPPVKQRGKHGGKK